MPTWTGCGRACSADRLIDVCRPALPLAPGDCGARVLVACSFVESVVLVDEAGNRLGVADKVAIHHDQTPLHLAFSCYVFDRAGQFLLTRRAESKRVFPGVWTNSCCGHPAPDEAMADAVRRRVRQELGIELGDLRLILPAFRYQARMDGVLENEICPVYAGSWAGPLDPDPAEVADVTWVDWADFTQQIRTGQQPISPWCALQVAELTALAGAPLDWAAASTLDLPPAARPV
jgi:isopentenyl-diphosphate delta-isomerase